MTGKIHTDNGEVLCRSTYRPLTPAKLLNNDGSDAKEQFMAKVYETLESSDLPRELEGIALENIPHYDPHENETQNKQTFPQLAEEPEPMLEVGDHYIEAEILHSREDKITRGNVVAQSHDANGNVMGRAMNPILDTRHMKLSLLEVRLQN